MENKEVKKMSLKKKILIIIFVIILLIFLITIRKFIIISNLERISKNTVNNTNYYIEKYTLQCNNVNITKSYNKDSKYLTTIQNFGIDIPETREILLYEDGTSQIGILQSGENKVAFLDGNLIGGKIGINNLFTYETDLWTKLNLSALSSIKSEECNNKKCYLVKVAPTWKLWIDKETALVVREINSGIITDYNYKFDIVKDEDIAKPDISDCKIQK